MPRTLRFNVYLWKSQGDSAWSGRLLDGTARYGTACGPSAETVLKQLKEYIQALDAADSLSYFSPDFEEPEVRIIKVQAVPEYAVAMDGDGIPGHQRQRTIPCAEPVSMKIPYVVGKRESGLVCAVFPTLDVEFEISGQERLEEMALHYARQELKGLTPAQLIRHLPPAEWKLGAVSHTPRKAKEKFAGPDLKNVAKVAEYMASPAVRKSSRAWERDKEIAEVETRLRQPQGSLLLVGEPGCGKTAVLIEAVWRIEKRTGDNEGKLRRFWTTSGARLVAGMRWLGEWQERLEEVLEEIRNVGGVLCFEGLQELMRLGGSKPESSIAAFLMPYLRAGELRVVMEATAAEMDACERMLPGFLDAFSILRLEPLERARADRVLELAAKSLSGSHKLDYSLEAAREAGRLCRRFQPYAGFPGAPVGIMNETASRAREEDRQAVSVSDVRAIFGEATGLPLTLLDDSPHEQGASLESWFSERLVSQPRAVDAVCRTLVKFKTGLNDPRRPLAVLFFTGPTGTGKTQLARLLGDWLFPNRKPADRLVRLDMSEYAGYDAARRLLGDPFGEPSDLVKRMRQNPFTVLLLDEVEKAAPDVFDTLMNVFDEGRLTDALGRTTWFRSTVIIMTSNLGASGSRVVGFSGEDAGAGHVVDTQAITQFFRPEFFNRLDQVVSFDALNRPAVEAIARREIAALEQREGLARRGLKLEVDDRLLQEISEQGFDPIYGARPLQRRLEELLVTPLSVWLVAEPDVKQTVLKATWEEGRTVIAPRGERV